MIFSVQYRLPDYYRWLLYEADHAPAYRFHRIFLQHLQSGVPGQWLLKSPAHLWQLDTLVDEYPDALIVQTHRDPLNVISSITALTGLLRRMASDETDLAECAAQSYEEIVVGLDRSMALRDELPAGQVTDVLFAEFMRDPLATIAASTTAGPRAAARHRAADARLPGRHIPATAAAAATPGPTPAWMRREVRERVRGYQERLRSADRGTQVVAQPLRRRARSASARPGHVLRGPRMSTDPTSPCR